MTYNIGPLTVSPGVAYNNILQNAGAIQAIKLTNGTQFDLTFQGFGTPGTSVIPAGLEYMLHASDGNSGYINFIPVDSLGVGGSGVVNAVAYFQGEDLPQGQWPATVPAQRVILPAGAGAVVADHLINTTSVGSASPIINIEETGATGPEVFADNQGNFYIQQYVSSVLTTLFRTLAGQPSNSANVLLGDASHIVQSNGQFNPNLGIHATSYGVLPTTNTSHQIDGSNVGGSAVVSLYIHSINGAGFLVFPDPGLADAAWHAYDCTGDNAQPSTASGFTGSGYYKALFDGANMSGIGAPVLNWNYGQILNNNAGNDNVIQSTNTTNLRMNAPTSQSVEFSINNANIMAIFAGFIQMLQYLKLDAPVFSTVNGSVSGVCNLYCPIWGSGLKIGIFQMLSNYQTAVAQTLLFPSSIAFGTIYSGSIGPNTTVQFNSGGTPAAMRQVTNIQPGANLAGTDAGCSNFHQLNLGQFGGSDRFIVNTTGGNNINSFGWFIGE